MPRADSPRARRSAVAGSGTSKTEKLPETLLVGCDPFVNCKMFPAELLLREIPVEAVPIEWTWKLSVAMVKDPGSRFPVGRLLLIQSILT